MMRMWVDTRIGGRRILRILGEHEVPMLVPDEIRKCVVFVYYDDKNGVRRPAGTAFFVAVDRTHGIDGGWVHLVTAKHVLNGIRAKSNDGLAWLRCNLKEGGFDYVSVHVDRWMTHPDETVVDDVAVIPWQPRAAVFDYVVFPLQESVKANTGHGVGDEVFLPGLFVNHTGKERNIPIVRVGNIAAMPDEPIDTKVGPLEAYLVEARSIGGLSGSPVFVNLGLWRMVDGQLMKTERGGEVLFLLGMMHGHYQVKAPAKAPQPDEALMDDLSDEAINMGIAIVVPADRIAANINQPKLIEERTKRDREAAEEQQPVMDSTSEGRESEGGEFENFDAMASKLVQVPKSEIDAKRKEQEAE